MFDMVDQENPSAISKTHFVIPADNAVDAKQVLSLALRVIGNAPDRKITLVGVTPVDANADVVDRAQIADRLRCDLDELSRSHTNTGVNHSIVSPQPWQEINELINDEAETLLLLPWRSEDHRLRQDLAHVLRDPPCDVAVVHSPVPPTNIRRVLLPVRGGPFALLSLQLALRMARSLNAEVTLLRVLPADDDAASRVLREGFTGLSDIFPEITSELQVVGDPTTTILRMLDDHQAIVLGASASLSESPVGLVASLILHRDDVTSLVVRTREPFRLPAAAQARTDLPVIVRLEKWLAENTFHSGDFSDVGRLVDLKRKQGLKISLALPTLNDEATISIIITAIKGSLVDDVPLLDELVVIDNGSTDATRRIAAAMGVQSYASQHVLHGYGSMRGKGEALWKSLYLLKGDLVLWAETDIINPDPGLILGIAGPLLADARLQYVKGFHGAHGSGPDLEPDHITDLLLRPMISLLVPDLAGIVSPLAGSHGGRRSALERIPFYSGYGVEAGMLLDILARFGLRSIAQVDLGRVTRSDIHDQRSLAEKTAFSVLQVFARHLKNGGGVDPQLSMERTIKLLRAEQERFHLEEIDVHQQQRPPMLVVREYRGRHLAAPVLNQ